MSVQNYKHVSVGPRGEHVAGEDLYLIRHNWGITEQSTVGDVTGDKLQISNYTAEDTFGAQKM